MEKDMETHSEKHMVKKKTGEKNKCRNRWKSCEFAYGKIEHIWNMNGENIWKHLDKPVEKKHTEKHG